MGVNRYSSKDTLFSLSTDREIIYTYHHIKMLLKRLPLLALVSSILTISTQIRSDIIRYLCMGILYHILLYFGIGILNEDDVLFFTCPFVFCFPC